MQRNACTGVTCSLDDVVQQSVQQASASLTSPPINRYDLLSDLIDADASNDAAQRLSQTPTAQALRTLCHAFIERYHALDALHCDTAWWTSEVARLREEQRTSLAPAPAAAPHTSPPSALFSPLEKEELLQRTAHLLRATHSRDIMPETSIVRRASSSPLGAVPDPPPHMISTAVNVLQLDDAVPATDNTWDSLDLVSGSAMQRSADVHGRVRKDEECLRVLDAWVVGGDVEGSGSVRDSERLESLVYLLRHRPELVTGHAEASLLQRRVVSSTCRSPAEPWIAAAFTLFQAVGAHAQLDFIRDAIACAEAALDPSVVGDDVRLLTFILRLLRELPECWTSLLDSEVTDVFLLVVAHVVVPFADALDQVDPVASWLAQWSMRPSFSLSMTALLRDGADAVARLHAQQSRSSHAACVLLHLLPHMVGGDSGTAGVRGGDGAAAASASPAWLPLFRDLTQALTDAAGHPTSPVFELGFCSLASCAARLPQADQNLCIDRLLHSLLSTQAELLPLEEAPAGVAAVGGGAYVFGFRLLTELLLLLPDTSGEFAAQCGSPGVWDAIDGPLRTQLQTHLATTSVNSLTGADVRFLQQAWTDLLCAHASRLPLSLAALVAATLTAQAEPPAQQQQRPPRSLFSWATLAAVSSTGSGWTALHPHLMQISTDKAPPAAIGRWAALLRAIVAHSPSASSGAAAPFSTNIAALSSNCRLSPSRRTPETSLHHHIASCSPHSVALLLRWSTVSVACDGLVAAAQEAARFYFNATQRSTSKAGSEDCAMRWPLLWPVEAYPSAGGVDLSYAEDDSTSARNVRSLACYQSLALFLTCTALPSTAAGKDTLEFVWGQLVDVWLSPAQVLHDNDGDAPQPSPEQSSPINGPPFQEASLVTLLCAVAVCILVRPSAEYATWFAPDAVARRLRPLRRFCVARCGVDPVYFMVRYVTSGKGRKRLPAILLDGCEAELTVDTVVDVCDFAEGEEWPAGDVALPVTSAEVEDVLRLVKSQTSSDGSSTQVSSEVVALARRLLGHRAALRTTPSALQQLLAARTAEEWGAFAQTTLRALAVGNLLLALHPAAAGILRGADVDVFYLASLCVASWMGLPETHLTSSRRKLCWAGLRYVSQHGVAAFDGYVARSLAAHVERLHGEDVSCVGEALLLPQQRPLPLPSSLFVLLLVKPFSLAAA